MTLMQPTGDDKEAFWALDVPLGEGAQAFVDDQLTGVGFTGIWGSGAGIDGPKGKTVRERAEVWFNRV
jgi:hypothetical protein